MDDELINAVHLIARLLDHAVYDEERNDECISACEDAYEFIRRFPNAETQAAMLESRL